MSLAHISTIQALDIWTSLEEARSNEHSFGGDVAEIYVYRALPNVPAISQRSHEVFSQAFQAFRALFLEFQQRRDVLVYFSLSSHAEEPGSDFSRSWVLAEHLEGIPTNHRFYVRIGSTDV